MKKSWLCGAVALLMAFACMGAGCDEKSPTGNTVTPYEEIKSDKVTEEEWVAAFAEENFVNVSVKVEMEEREHYFKYEYDEATGDYVYNLAHKWDGIGTYTIKQTSDAVSIVLSYAQLERGDTDSEITVYEGDLAYWKELGDTPFSDEIYTEMYDVEDEKVAYRYYWSDGEKEYSFTEPELKDGYGVSDTVYGLINANLFKTKYSEFTYSEELQGYLWNYEDEAKWVVKFQNKKVSAVKEIHGSLDDEAYGKRERYNIYNFTFIFYDYGKTTVELPKEFQDKIAEYKELHK